MKILKLKRKTQVKKHKSKLYKRCPACNNVLESLEREPGQCPHCAHSFLPLNYLYSDQHIFGQEFQQQFGFADELCEEDLVKGIYVIW